MQLSTSPSAQVSSSLLPLEELCNCLTHVHFILHGSLEQKPCTTGASSMDLNPTSQPQYFEEY